MQLLFQEWKKKIHLNFIYAKTPKLIQILKKEKHILMCKRFDMTLIIHGKSGIQFHFKGFSVILRKWILPNLISSAKLEYLLNTQENVLCIWLMCCVYTHDSVLTFITIGFYDQNLIGMDTSAFPPKHLYKDRSTLYT